MKRTQIHLTSCQLVGTTVRTNNAQELDHKKAKIGLALATYFGDRLAEKIVYRSAPGVTYCVYTDFENDEHGEYTYFVGEKVSEVGELPHGFTTITLPEGPYSRFVCGPGPLPKLCVNAWQKIWRMPQEEVGGERAYHADFEVYDQRAANPEQAIFDIYLGLNPYENAE